MVIILRSHCIWGRPPNKRKVKGRRRQTSYVTGCMLHNQMQWGGSYITGQPFVWPAFGLVAQLYRTFTLQSFWWQNRLSPFVSLIWYRVHTGMGTVEFTPTWWLTLGSQSRKTYSYRCLLKRVCQWVQRYRIVYFNYYLIVTINFCTKVYRYPAIIFVWMITGGEGGRIIQMKGWN